MGTGMQEKAQGNEDRHQRWDRIACAALGERYGDLQAQGLAQRQAAKMLDVPRSTLQAWRAYHERLDARPVVGAVFRSVAGLAFLHRLVVALHVVETAVGACGMRLVWLFLRMTGLNRCVGASYGTPHQVHRRVAETIVAYRQEESARLGREMPATDLPIAQEETCTGGLSLRGSEPVSNASVYEHAALARAQDPWHALMEQALAGLHGQVMQSTSDAAPGRLASVAHPLGAPHAPDLFQRQHALSQAVSAPMAVKQRAAAKAVAQAAETLKRVQESRDPPNGACAKRGPGRPPNAAACLEQMAQAVATARQEPQRLAGQRETVTQSRRALGHAYHVVD